VVRSGTAALSQPKLFQNPATVLLQKDSGKISYIKISQQQPYHFDNFTLKLTGVKYFSRKADLYIPGDGGHSFVNPGRLVKSFTISNNSTLQFSMPVNKAGIFYLFIDNEDNLPLQVSELTTAFTYHYITAYLETGNSYKLILDNHGAIMPAYDLDPLNTKISDSIPVLPFGVVTAFKENMITVTPVKSNNWLLWIAIGAALIILLLLTIKMAKEIDKRKQDDSL
jgi:hypothetical protein